MQILLLSLPALLVWAAPVVVARQAAATAPLSIRSTAQMPTAGNRQTVQGARGRLTEVRSRSIRAQPLRGEPYSSRDGTTARYPVELTGELVSIDRAREILRVRTNQGPQVVELFDETEYGLESGRAIRLSELRPGTEVRISGEERNGRILAHRLVVLDPAPYPQRADAPNTGSRGVIVGTVRTPTHLVSRKIKVRTPDGDVTARRDRTRGSPSTMSGYPYTSWSEATACRSKAYGRGTTAFGQHGSMWHSRSRRGRRHGATARHCLLPPCRSEQSSGSWYPMMRTETGCA
jgi:hypothetical protein